MPHCPDGGQGISNIIVVPIREASGFSYVVLIEANLRKCTSCFIATRGNVDVRVPVQVSQRASVACSISLA